MLAFSSFLLPLLPPPPAPCPPARPLFPAPCSSSSFTIASGEKVAIVGTSGSGKSSVIRLLERFYDPQQGQVLIDDQDIASINVRTLRNAFGLVSQEPVLFDGTIADNIRMGHIDTPLSQDEMLAAARAAGAHQFITERLPMKYETDVGSAGHLLSGGEKQRIAIARAISRNPSVLLFDEAVSAVCCCVLLCVAVCAVGAVVCVLLLTAPGSCWTGSTSRTTRADVCVYVCLFADLSAGHGERAQSAAGH